MFLKTEKKTFFEKSVSMSGKAKSAKVAKKVPRVRRMRTILRDTIGGFMTLPTAKRMLYVGSAMLYGLQDIRLGGLVKEELAMYSRIYLEDLLKKAAILTLDARRTTINTSDIVEAARLMGRPIYPVDYEVETIKSVEDLKKMAKKSKKSIPKDITVSSKVGFSRFAREICQDIQTGFEDKPLRFSKYALVNSRIWLETILIEMMGKAARLAVNIGGRKTLMPKDLQNVEMCIEN